MAWLETSNTRTGRPREPVGGSRRQRSENLSGGTADMNANGESDGSIVPLNPANKGGTEPPAESAEGRGPARSNTDQSNLRRTPSRKTRRSSGLNGVRKAARQDRRIHRGAFRRSSLVGLSRYSGMASGRTVPHAKLAVLLVAITAKRRNWVLGTDIEDCEPIGRDWFVRFIEHRVGEA